jgi:hypothetical protein
MYLRTPEMKKRLQMRPGWDGHLQGGAVLGHLPG